MLALRTMAACGSPREGAFVLTRTAKVLGFCVRFLFARGGGDPCPWQSLTPSTPPARKHMPAEAETVTNCSGPLPGSCAVCLTVVTTDKIDRVLVLFLKHFTSTTSNLGRSGPALQRAVRRS